MIINYGARLTGNVKTGAFSLKGNVLTSSYTISGKLICGAGASELPSYTGPYTVTPTRSTQILQTLSKKTTENIVVNPIPPNYGLISWDGSSLTVS